ncbi:MAG: hypothetical protein ACRCT6_09690 [Notoacmeibacter sp.]
MNMIDRAKAHYKALANEPKRIEIPEWGEDGEPAVVFVTPITLAERNKMKRVENGNELAAEILIMKAQDKDGNPVFKKEDKIELMRFTDSRVVGRVITAIVGDDDNTVMDDMEKN